jgi:hypothetical protein
MARRGQRKGKSRQSRSRRTASRKVRENVHEMKRGRLRSGRSGKKVRSRKQAVAIGLSQARRSGARIPKKRGSRSRSKRSR